MKQQNIIKQACVLTTISEKAINKFIQAEEYAIVDAIEDMRLTDENTSQLDIGIGYIYAHYEEGSLKWRFEPKESLEKACKEAIINKKNLLSETCVKTISAKLSAIYKDLL